MFKVFKQPQIKDDNNHLASELSTKFAKLVNQGAASPRIQDIKHIANHSDAVLYLSKHTHKHRANHSIMILFESKSERADLPNKCQREYLALANTGSSGTNMLLKSLEIRGTL